MDCVNHSGVPATAYCQNCGKGLCNDCIIAGAMRNVPGGKVLCSDCITAWQSLQPPFAGLQQPSGPNPAAAAVLGLIPGVGAMYNGQFFKGFIHVVVFAVLISIADHYPIFGLFIAAWVLYQSFEAFHTAKAMREGQPVPDPFGLNEVGNWLNMGTRLRAPGQPGAGPTAANFVPGASDPAAGSPPPFTGTVPPPYVPPPIPPIPAYCHRGEPVGAIVLIGLGLLFLLGQLDIFHGRFFDFAWPLMLIGLGVWLIVRRIGDSPGGGK